mmetsp:Transcript_48021/g.71550  ORF Transcript_48021/g.71550 Transcript_48021/m.71550 type:complete len:218 (+) Transcript_48021:4709-5362(+)
MTTFLLNPRLVTLGRNSCAPSLSMRDAWPIRVTRVHRTQVNQPALNLAKITMKEILSPVPRRATATVSNMQTTNESAQSPTSNPTPPLCPKYEKSRRESLRRLLLVFVSHLEVTTCLQTRAETENHSLLQTPLTPRRGTPKDAKGPLETSTMSRPKNVLAILQPLLKSLVSLNPVSSKKSILPNSKRVFQMKTVSYVLRVWMLRPSIRYHPICNKKL